MTNNLRSLKKDLCTYAKKCQDFKYTDSALVTFLITGAVSISNNLFASKSNKSIERQKQVISTSIKEINQKVRKTRTENNKHLKNTNLELIQLMEQGDYVVKSPWSSWQYAINGFYNNWSGTYKGRGDKSAKYPYEGVYTRSTNVFGRSTSARTAEQKAILNSIIAASGGFNLNDTGLNYGLIGRAQINEDPISIEISAGIRPKNIQKGAITLSVSPVNVIQPSPSVTLGITNTPAAPNINIPSFSPVAPKVEAPALPVPPTFAVVVGSDCNAGCNSGTKERQNTKDGFNLAGRAAGNIENILHYTWPARAGLWGLPGERASLAFKMYAETRKDFTLGTNKPREHSGRGGGPGDWGSTTVAPTNVYFNSYNFGDEYTDPVASSANGTNLNKNNQHFFVGGSRFIESDDVYAAGNTLKIPNGYTVNLGGILTLGLVSQGHKTTQLNAGTITDKEEKNDNWIKNMTYDTSGAGVGKYLTIKGPTEDYHIKRSTDGYVGYKVALALIQEDEVKGGAIINDTTGVIDFRGEKSIGLYTYLPNPANVDVKDYCYSNRPMINKGSILLSGIESYGMKYAATEVAGAVDFVNDQNANITLRKNPDSTNGDNADRADNSTAMALMRDKSVTTKVTLTRGKAINKGNIFLKDNISNALGMFVNIDSDMTNEGTIKISAVAPKVSDKYQFNVAMRADQADLTYEGASAGNTEVINKKDIKLTGQGAMGMIANGSSTSGANTKYAIATNDAGATIELNKEGTADSKDNFAMLAANKAEVVNKGTIKIGDSKGSVGMAALKQGLTHSTAKNEGSITIDGAEATGVYNTGHFLMDNASAKITVKGNQSIGLYAKETDLTHTKTELKQGTVKSENGAVALYSDEADVTLDNTSGNLKLIAGKGGLLFYNYKSSNPDQYDGQFTLKGTVKPEIEAGGYGFYLKNATINNVSGEVQGVPAFLDAMFNLTPGAQKLKVNMQAGGTFMVLHKPTGGSIKLSSVNNLSSINSALGTKVQLVAPTTGSYKIYSVYRGNLAINQDVNLDNDDSTPTPDAFYRVDFRSSNIVLDATKTIAGTKQGQVALFQGNYDEGTSGDVGTVGDVSIVNNGTINLTGDSITSGPAANRKTTTAMAGDFITLTNNKTIEVTGNSGIGIYGAGGSKILNSTGASVTVGQEGVALYGANKLNSSTLGDGTISVTNAGDIKGVSGKTKAFGIFAENTSAIGDSVLTNSGTIDFSSSQESIGIHSINSTVSNTGKIKMGLKGIAINAKNSDINSAGDIVLAGDGIAFNLGGSFTGRTLNFSSKVTLNGDGNSIFNLKDMSFSSVGASLTENVSVVPNGKSFAYFSMDNSSLIYDKDKAFSGNKITLVSAKNSTVDWRSNVALNGEENIAFYMNGRKTGAALELKTAAGKTITLGNKSVGSYGTNGARIENNSDIVIGSDGAALYSTGVNGSLKNTGKLTLGKNSVGMFMKDGTALTNIGEIISTAEGAKGLVINNATPSVYTNNGKIKLDGTSSIGIHAEGAAHAIISAADVEVGDTAGTDQSVAIHLKDGGQVRVLSNTSVKAGKNSIGIYGSTISTTVENNAKVEVGDGAIGIYAKDGNVDLDAGSKMKIGETLGANKEAVGVYYVGTAGTINNNLAAFDIGKGSIGIVDAGTGATTINNNLTSVNLKGDSVYTYTSNTSSNVIGNTVITSAGNGNYGYYVAGNLENYGVMDLDSGDGNVGIYSAYKAGTGTGIAKNYANIKVGKTDLENESYSIGMAAGYTNKDRPSENKVGHVINMAGSTITVGNKNSIGMYASGAGSTAENYGTIHVTAKKGIGMYLESGATGINRAGGLIEIDAAAQNAIAVYSTGATTVFKNYGTIRINAPGSKGIVTANGANNNVVAGNIDVQNSSAEATKNIEGTAGGDKVFGDKTLSVPRGGLTDSKIKDSAGNIITPTAIDTTSATNTAEIQVSNDPIAKATYNRDILKEHEDFGSVSKIGMYVDTSGVNFTNPIEGLHNLTGLKEADLIIGAEAAEYTNAKTITVGKNILKRYNNVLLNSGVDKWNILSGSLTWAAVPLRLNGNGEIQGVLMTKVDYKEYAKNSTTPYSFLDGLEQRYDMNALDSREKRLFNKLNSIGKNEPVLLSQAFDEMMGHQYGNLQQRINTTGNLLDKEFKYLKHDWRNPSKQNNKIKVFGMRDEYNTDTAGIIDYTSNAYGVAYVHEDEKIKLGNSSGWYAGAVTNRFKFKDIGKSRENQTMLKAGVFKTMSPKADHNGALQWTVGGDVFAGINDMKRKYLVVDEIFQAKSDYHSYGAALKTDLGYDIRMSERTHLRPYGALKMEYGRFNDIKEDRGEMRLEVKGNNYFSVKPEVGMEFKYVQPMAVRTKLSVGVTAAYENELGKVGDVNNKGRVRYTTADKFGIRGEKEDRRGNGKFDLNVGVDNTRFGVTVNAGYDTKGNNVRGGIGFRAIY
ncbi:autotransporter-associated N-terminal domain-containing protein [Leptotrichia alba]|uniref:Autotransporter-associated N-terminal domain-containing protein n=1 Tax=Leptotrichia alba TaxID=3239304 RepID=A0AB39V2I4_9FUSO